MELITQIEDYVSSNIGAFHNARIQKLKSLNLIRLLKNKNPYLYKAKNLNTPQEIVESIASAFLSSAEETMFGDWLEQLAIFIAHITFNGKKSSAEGIDLEMDKDGVHYLISIKSGPRWSNSSSLAKLRDNFAKARRIYRTSGNKLPCEAIEGCCYGIENNPDKTSHLKLCGEVFWDFISGYSNLYLDIVQPLGKNAKEKNAEYMMEYNRMITRFTKEFSSIFCNENGDIEWDKIVRLNSSSSK